MPVHTGIAVDRVFTAFHSQDCRAYLRGVGWCRVRAGALALAPGMVVTAVTDDTDSVIEQIHL